MTPAAWAALLTTFTLAVVVPGPDTFLILRLGVRDRRAAVTAGFGIMTGNLVWTVASVLGLAALMRALPALVPIVQVAGSLILVWIGAQSIRGGITGLKLRTSAGTADMKRAHGPVTAHPFRLGVITNLSNPKALLFFTALFSQLLPGDATAVDRTLIVIALTVIGLAWFSVFAWFTSSQTFQRWFGRITPIIDIAAGLIFLAVAGAVLFELIRSLN